MYRRMIRAWVYQTLTELSKGRKKIEDLKKELPIYGTAFDFFISYLLTSGLAKKTIEDNVEYLEITDLGKSLLSGVPWLYGPLRWASRC
ncbi:MAG: hypothetical protein QXY68_08150 [Saccharolobus sp.]